MLNADEMVTLSTDIVRELERIRGMRGYTERDESGSENSEASVWLGASLQRIEDMARRISVRASEEVANA